MLDLSLANNLNIMNKPSSKPYLLG